MVEEGEQDLSSGQELNFKYYNVHVKDEGKRLNEFQLQKLFETKASDPNEGNGVVASHGLGLNIC